MSDVLLSSQKLLDRLGHEELALKKLGLVNQAAGLRVAITLLIKETQAAIHPREPLPVSLDDSPP